MSKDTNKSVAALKIYSGSAPANVAAADTGTVLATLNLPSDWMAQALKTTPWYVTKHGGEIVYRRYVVYQRIVLVTGRAGARCRKHGKRPRL